MADAPSLIILAAGLARRYGGCKPLAPVGPRGEAVIDLLASDALAAGFGQLVLVLHPTTGPAIRYHVERTWPDAVPVEFAEQHVPLGTTHAVLAARAALDDSLSFAVGNADDIYGATAMRLLAQHLGGERSEHALVGYSLASTIVTDDPVTRGVCKVDAGGHLVAITERRQVSRADGGTRFTSADGLQPAELSATTLVSVNLWGFQPSVWGDFRRAMDASGLDEEALAATLGPDMPKPPAEVLLPEVVGSLVAGGSGQSVRVLPTDTRCIGVTHADDLPVVQAELARQVAGGTRPDRLWSGA